MNRRHVPFAFVILTLAAGLAAESPDNRLAAQEASWIWSPEHRTGEVPQGTCYFRRRFSVSAPTEAKLYIAADDKYELYLNGRRIGSGGSTEELDEYDVSKFISNGGTWLPSKPRTPMERRRPWRFMSR